MFALNSIFIGELDKHIVFFSDKVYSHSATFEQYLAPIIGILVNLSIGMKQHESDENNQYETLATMFERTDAFNERGLSLF
jgi:hypothetical protein